MYSFYLRKHYIDKKGRLMVVITAVLKNGYFRASFLTLLEIETDYYPNP